VIHPSFRTHSPKKSDLPTEYTIQTFDHTFDMNHRWFHPGYHAYPIPPMW